MRLLLLILVLSILVPVPLHAATREEFRAFWVDAFNDGLKTEAQVRQLVDNVAAANANAIIVQVRRRGDVYYQSSIEPRAQDADLAPVPYDPLRTLLDAAHQRGIEVHAWIATLTVWKSDLGTPPVGHVLRSHGVGAAADWVMRANNGATTDSEGNTWLDPGNPAVVAYTEAVVRDLLTHYPDLDGLHLDRIRYPGTSYGYNPQAVAQFNKLYGRTGQPDPADELWTAWRREQVTGLVHRSALALAELAPRARLSAAVIAWGDGPDQVGGWENSAPYKQVLQDWRGWLHDGLLDTAVVMNYDRQHDATQSAYFRNWVTWETTQAGGPVVVGSAAYLNSVEGTVAQVQLAQQTGAAGVALYSYATTTKDNLPPTALIAALRLGPFAVSATVPPMPWKERVGGIRGTLPKGFSTANLVIRGPDARDITADASGWFEVTGLAPGTYNLVCSFGADRVAYAQANVVEGRIASVEKWSVAELSRSNYLPLIQQEFGVS